MNLKKVKTVADIQQGFARMIGELETIEEREEENFKRAEAEMERAHKESAAANRFRSNLQDLLGGE